ncbi:MAG: hypothetical protein JXM70_10690 [Pirellulales bacterium]|nr:hypothetical protein [Pirellulales bacterium]
MRMSALLLVVCIVICSLGVVKSPAIAADTVAKPATVRDMIWVWGNPELAKPGPHTLATFASADPAQRAKLLGVSNIVMAGMGLPNDDAKADELTRQVAAATRLVWETTPDGKGIGPPFVYKKRMAQIRRLAQKYPQLEGVLLDDMSTGKMDRGFKPEHIRHMREELSDKYPAVKIWGVTYTMSLQRPHINEYLKEVDIINLWEWHSDRLGDFEKHVAHCEKLFPDKPIILGLYLYDYGGGKKISLERLEFQCELALKLAHAGRIEGIVFLTINDDEKAVRWAADWITRVGGQKLAKVF